MSEFKSGTCKWCGGERDSEAGVAPGPSEANPAGALQGSHCGTQRCADLGCFGYCQSFPSQPVAGLMEEERSSLRRVKYLLDHNTKGFLPGYGNMVNITVSVTDAKIASAHLDRLTSSPVSEEELAKAIYDATPFPDLGGGPLHWSHVSREIKDRYRLRARALLNQFSIGRK